jgi:Fe-S-cluster-containing hydrogenase component 2
MIIFSEELCTICGQCVVVCPEEAIQGKGFPGFDKEKCSGCGRCVEYCPCDAIKLEDEE